MQLESGKGKNVPKQENFLIKQSKCKNNFENKGKEGIKNQLMDIQNFENKSWWVQQRARFLHPRPSYFQILQPHDYLASTKQRPT